MIAADKIKEDKNEGIFNPPRELPDKLQILIDARKFRDGGIGTYIRNLVHGLLQTNEVNLTVLTKPGEQLPADWLGKIKVIQDPAKPYSFDEMWNLADRIDFTGIDLFHVPHFTLPYKVPVPAVITVHDLIHINFPEKKYYPWIAGPLIKSSLKRASKILTVSNASKNEIERLVKSSRKILSKVRVVPNAIDSFFVSKSQVKPAGNSIKNKVSGKYFLGMFSNIKPHKGLKDLLLAYDKVQKETGTDIRLILGGFGTENIVSSPEILDLTSNIKGVSVLGVVNNEELAELYRNAEALVVPSLAEGFYLPALEAQTMGTTVITRPVPSILELLTPRDIVCDDFSLAGLSAKIKAFLQELPLREAKVKEADSEVMREHLKRFDDLDLAKTVLNVYKETLLK